MNSWNSGIRNAICYIEEHLTEDIDVNEITSKAFVSSFYFQKIFNVLCGFTVGEYIKNRRLTLAAQELCSSDIKVLDVALKYGYSSPDSFAKAFTKFHGITPSQAREKNCSLNSVAPLKIKLTLEGGTMLEYKIVEKEQFTVMGVSRKFNSETSYQKIPEFWQEHMKSENGKIVCGMYGICMDSEGQNFEYLIADNYSPASEVPQRRILICRSSLHNILQNHTLLLRQFLVSDLPLRTRSILTKSPDSRKGKNDRKTESRKTPL